MDFKKRKSKRFVDLTIPRSPIYDLPDWQREFISQGHNPAMTPVGADTRDYKITEKEMAWAAERAANLQDILYKRALESVKANGIRGKGPVWIAAPPKR